MTAPDARPPVPEGDDDPFDDGSGLEGVLRIHPDQLVDFVNAFFAAMEAMGRGPAGPVGGAISSSGP